jgi:hypothetical protein
MKPDSSKITLDLRHPSMSMTRPKSEKALARGDDQLNITPPTVGAHMIKGTVSFGLFYAWL